jgi:hypothetical protein
MRRTFALALLVLASAAAAGCGGSGTSEPVAHDTPAATQQRSGLTIKQQAAIYLRLVGPANAEWDKLLPVWKDESTTFKEFEVAAAPAIAADEKFDRSLLRVRWSPEVRPDILSLVKADAAVIGDMVAIESVTDDQISRDLETMFLAAAAVRSDLGLPDAK